MASGSEVGFFLAVNWRDRCRRKKDPILDCLELTVENDGSLGMDAAESTRLEGSKSCCISLRSSVRALVYLESVFSLVSGALIRRFPGLNLLSFEMGSVGVMDRGAVQHR